jgi:mono/diheme cytochrome c family protein
MSTSAFPSFRVGAALCAALLAFPAAAAGLSIELPPETAAFRPAAGVEIANTQCLICHSADYVLTQPPTTTRAQWKAIVEKMRQRFGAPLAAEQVDALADYLAKTYGAGPPKN